MVVVVSLSQAQCLAASLTLRRRKNMIAAISKTLARITGVNVPTVTHMTKNGIFCAPNILTLIYLDLHNVQTFLTSHPLINAHEPTLQW